VRWLSSGNYPYGMNNPRNVTEQGQQDIDPELKAQTDLQKYAQRRQQNSNQDSNDVHDIFCNLGQLRL
jgi:hypothetical protein